jgi:hypothetical protein
LILAPAATPMGSKLSNSPCIGFGGTAAFQIPPLRAAGALVAGALAVGPPAVGPLAACEWETPVAIADATAKSAHAHAVTGCLKPMRPFNQRAA